MQAKGTGGIDRVPFLFELCQFLNFKLMGKKIRSLLLMVVTSVSLVYFLFVLSKVPNTYSNGFKRNISDSSLLVTTYYRDLKSDECYIAGYTDKSVYVGDYDRPGELLCLNDSFTSFNLIRLSKEADSLPVSVRSFVERNRIVLSDRESRRLFEFKPAGLDGIAQFQEVFKIPPVNALCPISSSTYVIRSPDSGLRKNSIIKWDQSAKTSKQVNNILQKQIDGFFCTDGILNFDPVSSRFVYVYFYRNQFISFDTNLFVIYRGNTIDTNRFAKIKVSRITSEDSYTFSAPPITVNQQSCTGNGLIFIRSGLLADNEDRQVFGKTSVIDTYNLSNGSYRFSFQLLDFDGFKIKDFAFVNHHIIAIQGHYITYFPFTVSHQR